MISTNNRWYVIIWHTLLANLMMQAGRLLYFFYNQSFFPEVGTGQLLRLMRGGYVLDMVAIGYGFLLYYLMMLVGAYLPARVEMSRWYRGVRHAAYFVPYTLFAFLNVSDTGYFPFVLRRVNSEVFSEFEGKSAVGFYREFMVDFWPLTLAFIALVILGVLGYRLVRLERSSEPSVGRVTNAVCSVVLVVFLFFGMRGRWDFKGEPVYIPDFARYTSDYHQMPIVQNTPVALMKKSMTRQEFDFYDEETLSRIFSPYYRAAQLAEGDTLFASMKGRNVVILLLESMGREYTGFFNREIEDYVSYTPFLDSLCSESLYARYGFATGKRSVESFPSIFVSLPSFGGTFNDKNYRMDNYRHFDTFDTGLPCSLRDSGYELKFYHGDEAGAMGFFPFLQKLGVEEQYTAEDYLATHEDRPEDRINGWGGIHDLPFMTAMAEDMNHLQEPFGALFFSLSNHHPFKLPPQYVGKLRKGTLPIHETAQYADLALRRFFDRVKDEPWYPNTLFVLTADHTNLSDHPAYDNLAGHAAVPIAFFDPQGKLKGEIDGYVVQHTDILPTLLYLLGIEDPVLSYGSNILDPNAEHIGLNFFYNQYLLFAKEVTVTMTPYGAIRVEAPVPYLQTEKEHAVLPSEEVQEHYVQLLKAIAQDYNHRVFKTSFSIKDVHPRR